MEKQITMAMPVTAATIIEDRALVSRTLELELPAGVTELTSLAVTPLLVERTLVARVESGAVSVQSISFNREHCLRPKDPDRVASMQLDHQAATEKVEQLRAESELYKRQKKECENLLELWREQSASQAVSGQSQSRDWAGEYHRLVAAYQQYNNELLRLKEELRAAEEAYKKLDLEFSQVNSPVHNYSGRIRLLLVAKEATKARVTVEGIVACVAWRPSYQATLLAETVKLERQAMAWQQSGENWENVSLKFSTARPGKGASLPQLDVDVICLREKSEEERKIVQVVSQDVADDDIKMGSPGEALPGVADGGQVQCFELAQRVSLASGPRAKPFVLSTLELPNNVKFEARPELADFVALVSRQILNDSHPLLGGPVLLKRQDCLVGRSMLDFVAPGQSFELHFGSEDELTVRRQSQPVREKAQGSKNTYSYLIEDEICNLSAEERQVTVTERTPVSENAEITIEILPTTTADYQLADNGFLTWNLTLQPFEQKNLQLSMVVTTGKNIQWKR